MKNQESEVNCYFADVIGLTPNAEEYRAWSLAQKKSTVTNLKLWIISTLNAAAGMELGEIETIAFHKCQGCPHKMKPWRTGPGKGGAA